MEEKMETTFVDVWDIRRGFLRLRVQDCGFKVFGFRVYCFRIEGLGL